MLNWEHANPSRARPRRQTRGARQITIAARAEQRRESRRSVQRSR